MNLMILHRLKSPKIQLLFLLILIVAPAMGQSTVYFEYDSAGNQIERSLGNVILSTPDEIDEIVELIEEKLDNEDQFGESYLGYYPNPVKDYLNIYWENDINHTLETITLFNLVGQRVGYHNVLPNDSEKSLNLSQFAQGMYMVILDYTSGETKSIKIIKE